MGRDPRIVVVGAGIGGLACAIELATNGFEVVVLERAAGPGGKARTVSLEPASFTYESPRPEQRHVEIDAGPTVLTMPWVFEELFDAAGTSFRTEVSLEPATVLARHAWSDGTRLDLFADRQRSADAIGEVFGPGEARNYLDFCADGRRIYETAEGPFLKSQRPTMVSIAKQFGALGLSALTKIDSHRSMWKALEQRFSSPRLRQLFGRYATYCGSSPFDAPATLNLVAHVEAEGVFRVAGGMKGLALGLERVARALGVTFHYERNVESLVVERGQVVGVVVAGERQPASAVVFNGDVSALGSAVLGKEAARAGVVTAPAARSLSAVTWMMLAKPEGFPLLHHNVFFSDDYAREFDDIFRRSRVPDEPTIYVCAQDRADEPTAAKSPERCLVLVNAPATGDDPSSWNESEKERCTTAMERWLRTVGLTLEPSASTQATPADFHRLYPGTGGALYGPRSKGAMSALSRAAASTKLGGLYLAGGSVHPGPGVPMAALSGRLAAQQIRKDLGSTGRSRRVATTGTTSTG